MNLGYGIMVCHMYGKDEFFVCDICDLCYMYIVRLNSRGSVKVYEFRLSNIIVRIKRLYQSMSCSTDFRTFILLYFYLLL